MREQVAEALAVAAGADDDKLMDGGWGLPSHATSSRRRIGKVRMAISRFLENLPDDMMVHDIVECLDDLGEADDDA
jgi:hypothetical protein